MELKWRDEPFGRFLYVKEWEEEGFFHGFFDASLNPTLFEKFNLKLLNQVHGTYIETNVDKSLNNVDGDGWRGVRDDLNYWLLAIKTADCIPVILWNVKKRISYVLHAGREGILKGILYEAFRDAKTFFLEPKDFLMAIGPGISKDNYQIREDLVLEIKKNYPKTLFSDSVIQKERSFFLDLKLNLYLQALSLGVKKKNIVISDICTFNSKEFNSYRRDFKQAKRQFSIIGSDKFYNDFISNKYI